MSNGGVMLVARWTKGPRGHSSDGCLRPHSPRRRRMHLAVSSRDLHQQPPGDARQLDLRQDARRSYKTGNSDPDRVDASSHPGLRERRVDDQRDWDDGKAVRDGDEQATHPNREGAGGAEPVAACSVIWDPAPKKVGEKARHKSKKAGGRKSERRPSERAPTEAGVSSYWPSNGTAGHVAHRRVAPTSVRARVRHGRLETGRVSGGDRSEHLWRVPWRSSR